MLLVPNCSIQKNFTDSTLTFQDVCAIEEGLSGGAFKLYMYFLKHEGSSFYYDRSNCIGICAGSVNPINRAFTELVEAGYLKENGDKSYIFFKRKE